MAFNRAILLRTVIVLAVIIFVARTCDFRSPPYRVHLVQKTGMVKKILIYSTMNVASRETTMIEEDGSCLRLDKRVYELEFVPPQSFYRLYCSGITGFVRTNDVVKP